MGSRLCPAPNGPHPRKRTGGKTGRFAKSGNVTGVFDALAKGGLQVDWPAMLAQQVRKCLIGEFLKILHAIARQQIKSVPGLIVELDTFAAHQGPLRLSTSLATVNPGSAAL